MKSIIALKGTERGKCIIIGGGNSVKEFFKKYSYEVIQEFPTMAVNFCFLPLRIYYQVYMDNFFLEWLKDHKIDNQAVLVGFWKKVCSRTNYFFDFNIIREGFHTGFYALQIAQFLGFEEIYLVGFDYYIENDKAHYYENESSVGITDAEKKNVYSAVRKRKINCRF